MSYHCHQRTEINTSSSTVCLEEISLPSRESTATSHLLANLLNIHLIPSSRWFLKILKSTVSKIQPWTAPLVTGYQPDVTPFTKTLQDRPISLLIFQCITDMSSCVLNILSRRILWETISNALLKSISTTSTSFLLSARRVMLS